MASPDYIGCLYAITVAAGGIMGYVKKASVPSLVAGVAFGAAAAMGAYNITQNGDHTVMLATSGALSAFMGYRFYNTGKVMPAGLVCGLSLLMLARSSVKRLSG